MFKEKRFLYFFLIGSFTGLMVVLGFYLLALMLLESVHIPNGAEVGIYVGSLLITFMIFLVIYLLMRQARNEVALVGFFLYVAVVICGVGFSIYRLVEAVKASDKSQYIMISIHMASNVLMSPILSLLLIAAYVYIPSIFRKLVHNY